MTDESSVGTPLAGLRVLEAGSLVAGPFCGQLLGDYGAEVVKIEPTAVGDPMRNWGQGTRPLFWPILARNKKSVELDLRGAAGQEAFRRLAVDTDIVVENFRPGTMEKWGIGYEQLAALHPRIIYVRITGFGQTGPYSHRAGYAAVGEAMGGLRQLTGYPDRPPTRVGISLGDQLTGMFGALGALAAVQERHTTDRGQVIDAALYESVLATMESLIPEYVLAGHVRGRTGPVLPNVAPANVYPTKDGELIIAANQDTVFRRLAAAMGRPELATDPDYATHAGRGDHQSELDAIISEWSAHYPTAQVAEIMEDNGIPSGPVYRAPEMLADPHFAAREAIINVPSEVDGSFPMQNVVPKLSRTPGRVRWVGPQLGEHNAEILGERLHMTADEIKAAQYA